jgi:RNA polymerase sigma factor (TIGR02999 family)
MNSPSTEVTAVLRAIRNGDREAVDHLFHALYGELRRIAHGQRRQWQGDETLNTTALVHEAYLKLVGNEQAEWQDRAHFCAVAATAMRHILVNYAEQRLAVKRGGGAVHVPLEDGNPVPEDGAEDLLTLHGALERLSQANERQGRVVECRFFGGLGIRETAEVLGVSQATVERDWSLASAWLRDALDDAPEPPA